MTYETLVVERRGPVGWLIFNRPEVLNAHNLTMLEELPRAWRELDNDDSVVVIVNTGRGRGFSVGADVKETAAAGGMAARMAQLDTTGAEDKGHGHGARANNIWKPVIAAVNGVCAGGGLHFVVDADVVIAASDATFTDTHVTVGQVAALEPVGLFARMPFGSIMRMALMGRHERLSAQRAYEVGMVSQVVDPPETLEDVAQEIAETMARNSPSALMATKRAVWMAYEHHREAAMDSGNAILEQFWSHPDSTEGPNSFVDKRSPNWAPPTQTF